MIFPGRAGGAALRQRSAGKKSADPFVGAALFCVYCPGATRV